MLFCSFILLNKCFDIAILRNIREINFFKTARGTFIHTKTAVRTLIIVNNCKIIRNGNSSVGTSLFALFTADASVLAGFAGKSTALLIATHYGCRRFLGKHGDYLFGAGLGAKSTAQTA